MILAIAISIAFVGVLFAQTTVQQYHNRPITDAPGKRPIMDAPGTGDPQPDNDWHDDDFRDNVLLDNAIKDIANMQRHEIDQLIAALATCDILGFEEKEGAQCRIAIQSLTIGYDQLRSIDTLLAAIQEKFEFHEGEASRDRLKDYRRLSYVKFALKEALVERNQKLDNCNQP